MNFADRCAIAAGCLPKADYRAKLEALHREMLAALAVQALPHEPDNAPVAWQWLKSGTFRVNLPRTAERDAWHPLYAAPQLKPVAWMWDQANYPEHDIRGRGWYPAMGMHHPGMPWMTRNVTQLYAATGDAA